MRAAGLIALLLGLACGSTASEQSTLPPPPSGKSHEEFLESSKDTRPKDTVESDKMTLHVIDIGQGQAVLLEFPCGAVLVDTGGEKNDVFDATKALADFLESFFARRTDLNRTLAGLVISHPHIDHTRGIATVLSGYRVANVVTNGQNFNDLGGKPQMELHAWVIKQNRQQSGSVGFERVDVSAVPATGLTSEVIDPVAGCDKSAIDPEITAGWGQVSTDEKYSENPNDHSVAIRASFGKSSVLITGDLEFDGLDHLGKKYRDHLDLLDVDVYVVGHHGSKNATAPHLLRAMTPKIAVISAGPYERDREWTARRFAHPNVKAVNMLRDLNFGVSWFRKSKEVWIGISGAWRNERKSVFRREAVNHAIYATSWDGAIGVRMYANGWLEVETAR